MPQLCDVPASVLGFAPRRGAATAPRVDCFYHRVVSRLSTCAKALRGQETVERWRAGRHGTVDAGGDGDGGRERGEGKRHRLSSIAETLVAKESRVPREGT